ncbi:MAG: HAD family hydrolase [Halobacteriota archaeon]
MSPAAVAFDLDDTLVVPDRDRQTLLNEAATAVGAPPLSREAYLRAHADNLTTDTRTPIFAALLEGHDVGVDPTALATAYRRAVTDALVTVSGVPEMLSTLSGAYRLGLLTNGPVVAQRAKLDRLPWTDAFDVRLVTGELDAGKPDAAAFEALLEALGTTPEETVYVGDDVDADVAGASAAGMPVVQVLVPDGEGLDPRAVAHVDRAELPSRLPDVVASL